MTEFIVPGVISALVLWVIGLFFFPVYGVWEAKKTGEAELAQAHNEQKIQITKAQSRYDAAELNKKAAIIEAEAVAAQIEKIGTNLQTHGLYLRWQWIKMMEERPNSSVIYVPTEANLPILEAGRLQRQPQTEQVKEQAEEDSNA